MLGGEEVKAVFASGDYDPRQLLLAFSYRPARGGIAVAKASQLDLLVLIDAPGEGQDRPRLTEVVDAPQSRLCPVADPYLSEEALHMHFDRRFGDPNVARDDLVGSAVHQAPQNKLLSGRQTGTGSRRLDGKQRIVIRAWQPNIRTEFGFMFAEHRG